MNAYMRAYEKHKLAAESALALFKSYCGDTLPARVPGMDMVIRLAWRIECGRTIESAAAAEYNYRWNLALQSRVFGVPHALGH